MIATFASFMCVCVVILLGVNLAILGPFLYGQHKDKIGPITTQVKELADKNLALVWNVIPKFSDLKQE